MGFICKEICLLATENRVSTIELSNMLKNYTDTLSIQPDQLREQKAEINVWLNDINGIDKKYKNHEKLYNKQSHYNDKVTELEEKRIKKEIAQKSTAKFDKMIKNNQVKEKKAQKKYLDGQDTYFLEADACLMKKDTVLIDMVDKFHGTLIMLTDKLGECLEDSSIREEKRNRRQRHSRSRSLSKIGGSHDDLNMGRDQNNLDDPTASKTPYEYAQNMSMAEGERNQFDTHLGTSIHDTGKDEHDNELSEKFRTCVPFETIEKEKEDHDDEGHFKNFNKFETDRGFANENQSPENDMWKPIEPPNLENQEEQKDPFMDYAIASGQVEVDKKNDNDFDKFNNESCLKAREELQLSNFEKESPKIKLKKKKFRNNNVNVKMSPHHKSPQKSPFEGGIYEGGELSNGDMEPMNENEQLNLPTIPVATFDSMRIETSIRDDLVNVNEQNEPIQNIEKIQDASNNENTNQIEANVISVAARNLGPEINEQMFVSARGSSANGGTIGVDTPRCLNEEFKSVQELNDSIENNMIEQEKAQQEVTIEPVANIFPDQQPQEFQNQFMVQQEVLVQGIPDNQQQLDCEITEAQQIVDFNRISVQASQQQQLELERQLSEYNRLIELERQKQEVLANEEKLKIARSLTQELADYNNQIDLERQKQVELMEMQKQVQSMNRYQNQPIIVQEEIYNPIVQEQAQPKQQVNVQIDQNVSLEKALLPEYLVVDANKDIQDARDKSVQYQLQQIEEPNIRVGQQQPQIVNPQTLEAQVNIVEVQNVIVEKQENPFEQQINEYNVVVLPHKSAEKLENLNKSNTNMVIVPIPLKTEETNMQVAPLKIDTVTDIDYNNWNQSQREQESPRKKHEMVADLNNHEIQETQIQVEAPKQEFKEEAPIMNPLLSKLQMMNDDMDNFKDSAKNQDTEATNVVTHLPHLNNFNGDESSIAGFNKGNSFVGGFRDSNPFGGFGGFNKEDAFGGGFNNEDAFGGMGMQTEPVNQNMNIVPEFIPCDFNDDPILGALVQDQLFTQDNLFNQPDGFDDNNNKNIHIEKATSGGNFFCIIIIDFNTAREMNTPAREKSVVSPIEDFSVGKDFGKQDELIVKQDDMMKSLF